jgi:hypothetical protein
MRACQVSRALSDTARHRSIDSSSYTRFLLTQLDGNVEVIFADVPEVPPSAMGRFFPNHLPFRFATANAALVHSLTRAASS